MNFETSPFENDHDHPEMPEEDKQAPSSLDDYTSGLITRGFEVISKNDNVYYHPNFPGFRF